MARRRWLQYDRSQRAPNRCQPSAAPQGREEPAQRASTLLSSREENGRPRHRTVLPGSNLSEAAIGVASTRSGFRAEPSAADYSGA